MGDGYFILLADGYGAGLVLINARLHTEGLDLYGNPLNWWPLTEKQSEEEILIKHGLVSGPHFRRVIFD